MAGKEKKLILVGGGGHCKAVIDVILSAGRSIAGIIDNALPEGSTVLGFPVLGGDDIITKLANDDTEFIITVGQIKSSDIRRKIASMITEAGGILSSPVVAAGAHLAKGTRIGRGTVIMHHAIVNSAAEIGENCIINTGAIVEHDCHVCDFVHISTGAIINGAATVGNDTFIGSHATVAHATTITDGVIIGAGATAVGNIDTAGTYCGTPAKPIKTAT